jgi:thiol-disulfide isomerase/thioredoxin
MLRGDVDSLLLRALALLGLILVSALVAVVLKRRAGRLRPVVDGDVLTAADVGRPLGTGVTFVQFSTSTCTSCRTVRRVLAEHVAGAPGAAHVEVDAEERLDLARRLGILRTPTVVVLDGAGRVTGRFSGVPTPHQVRDAVPHLI